MFAATLMLRGALMATAARPAAASAGRTAAHLPVFPHMADHQRHHGYKNDSSHNRRRTRHDNASFLSYA